jgi:hypothetical protein
LNWQPATLTAAPGQIFNLNLKAVLSHSGSRNIEAVQAVLDWDPTRLRLAGITRPCGTCTSGANDGQFCTQDSQCPGSACGGNDACFVCPDPNTYNWLSSTFPNDCSQGDGLNAPCPGFPANDGDAFYTAFVQVVCNGEQADSAVVTPTGLTVVTFQFEVLAQSGGALVSLILEGGAVARTLVAGGFPDDPGVDVLRQIGPPAQITIAQCQPPESAFVFGCRSFTITPGSGTSPVAILVKGNPADSSVSCVNQYVQTPIDMCVGGVNHRDPCTLDADCPPLGKCKRFGLLGPTPVQLTPAQWGTLAVRGAALEPSKQYTVQHDCGAAAGQNVSTAVPLQMWYWGDVDHDAVCTQGTNNGTPCDRDDQCTGGGICVAADFIDIAKIVDAYKGKWDEPAFVAMQTTDLSGPDCTPNLDTNFIDIGNDVNAYKRIPYTCATPTCP